jgi:hypothetical protein
MILDTFIRKGNNSRDTVGYRYNYTLEYDIITKRPEARVTEHRNAQCLGHIPAKQGSDPFRMVSPNITVLRPREPKHQNCPHASLGACSMD